MVAVEAVLVEEGDAVVVEVEGVAVVVGALAVVVEEVVVGEVARVVRIGLAKKPDSRNEPVDHARKQL